MVALEPGTAAAVLVSGIYDLEPLVGTSINDALALDSDQAGMVSPIHLDLGGFPPTLTAHGADETDELKAQSSMFATALGSMPPLEIPGRNHFDVILDLATPGTVLGDAVGTLIESL